MIQRKDFQIDGRTHQHTVASLQKNMGGKKQNKKKQIA